MTVQIVTRRERPTAQTSAGRYDECGSHLRLASVRAVLADEFGHRPGRGGASEVEALHVVASEPSYRLELRGGLDAFCDRLESEGMGEVVHERYEEGGVLIGARRLP